MKNYLMYLVFFIFGMIFTANNPNIYNKLSLYSEELTLYTLEKIGKRVPEKEKEEEKEETTN